MPAYVYTGTLTDIGLGVLTGRSPRMRVRPEREAFGPTGLISAVPVDVDVDASGTFAMTLHASSDLVPRTRYVIEVGRFEDAFDGSHFHGVDTWTFAASAGGGPIVDQDGSPYPVYLGPPWPPGTPPGMYIDTTSPNAWGIKEEGVGDGAS